MHVPETITVRSFRVDKSALDAGAGADLKRVRFVAMSILASLDEAVQVVWGWVRES